MTSGIYRPPNASLENQKEAPEYVYATLDMARKITVVLLIIFDCFLGFVYLVSMVLGAREFGFVLLLISVGLAVLSYRAVVDRNTKLLWLSSALHIIPGANLVGLLFSLILIFYTKKELARYLR